MSKFRSKLSGTEVTSVSGFPILPLNTKLRGPAPETKGNDIVDEAIKYFRANVLLSSFAIETPADRVLMFLTLFLSQCLKRLEKAQDYETAKKLMFELAKEKFPLPGEKKWALGGHVNTPANRSDQDNMRKYMEQLREVATQRILDTVYVNVDGQKVRNKFWMQFSNKRFMKIPVQ